MGTWRRISAGITGSSKVFLARVVTQPVNGGVGENCEDTLGSEGLFPFLAVIRTRASFN